MANPESLLDSLEWTPVDAKAFKDLAPADKQQRMRHSSAHVLATALIRVLPDVQFAIGPATETGFFYDVHTSASLDAETLEKVEAEMIKIAKEAQQFEVATVNKADAVEFFDARGEIYKLDILGRIGDDTVTFYRNGEFIDLCAGPHVPNTAMCQNFKILNVSQVHWRNEERPAPQRILVTSWSDKKDLKAYLNFLQESKERDHRVLGPQLGLFFFHEWAAAAMWQNNGCIMRRELESFWRDTISQYDYEELLNPILYRKELFQTSGHWEHYQDDMFIIKDDDGHPDWLMKPMNCPDTMLYFRAHNRSYRDLPLRVAEGQILHRNEESGSIHGLMRTRQFCQDDAHIFLMIHQIVDEIKVLFDLLDQVYSLFSLEYTIEISTRPEKFMGEIAEWDTAEASLKEALDTLGKKYEINEGDGAFYGPKIDITINDSLGRAWQCGTIQLDFQLAQRFELEYTAADGSRQRPIVIHRAIFGSFERFIGVLIEHTAGVFPSWLAPVQVAILPVSETHHDYADELKKELKHAGIRAEIQGGESISYRVRAAAKAKIPYSLVVGDKEVEANTVTVRQIGSKDNVTQPFAEFKEQLAEKIARREFDVPLKRVERPKALEQAAEVEADAEKEW